MVLFYKYIFLLVQDTKFNCKASLLRIVQLDLENMGLC